MYRADGHGRAAYQPRILLAFLLYGLLRWDPFLPPDRATLPGSTAFRVPAGNSTPDHVTIARFRVPKQAMAGLLIQSLKLYAAANRTHATLEALVAELLSQAAEVDRAEDRQHGTACGDALPQALAGRAERLAKL